MSGIHVLFDAEGVLVAGDVLDRAASGIALRLGVSRSDVNKALHDVDRSELEGGQVSAKDLADLLAQEMDVEVEPRHLQQWIGMAQVYDVVGLTQLAAWAAVEQAAVVGGSAPGFPERVRADLASLLPPERHLYSHEADASLSSPEFYRAASECFQVSLDSMLLFSPDEERRKAATEAGCQAVANLGLEPPKEEDDSAGDPRDATKKRSRKRKAAREEE